MYHGKDLMEKYAEQIKGELEQLHGAFSQQPMTELTYVLKIEHKAAEKCHICL